ncbi:cytochrome c biogenesis protein DipZ [Rugosimonospora acidiphila]|uniref:Cytochrome c biogenesis protein DipZ n=1 Tax=Rugosimonospora acidiphila TaxID=556531 RepID=A0ABP9S733_9ACTN
MQAVQVPEDPVLTLVLIGLVGGLITGISPCILPVLPVIFLSGGVQSARTAPGAAGDDSPANGKSGSGRPGAGKAAPRVGKRLAAQQRERERRAGRRPYLVVAGLTLSFSVFTLLGSLVLRALPVPQDIIRWVGLAVLVLLGLGMMVPRVQALLELPFSRIPQRGVSGERGGFVLGLALGAVYVPCAGPVLAAIAVAGATGKIGGGTVVLTLAYAAGNAVPLLFFALAGRRLAERLRAFRRRQRRIRIAAGVVVIGLAVALTFNITDAIQRTIPDYTTGLNAAAHAAGGSLAKALGGSAGGSLAACAGAAEAGAGATLENCGAAPAISGITQWLNTPGGAPISLSSLKGKVVLVDFWAYSCINCQRAITHVTAWYSAYQADGFEVIGVHTPEYAFEHVASNVEAGANRLHIKYPVALDNNYTTWTNYNNESWPADYLIDSTGTVRNVSIGEGDYGGTESLIRQLLQAANPNVSLPAATNVADTTPTNASQTPETYLGLARAQTYGGDTPLQPGTATYKYPSSVPADEFALTGTWSASDESLTAQANAGITLNYLADDIYLDVGGTGTITATVDGKTTTYQVSGAPNIYTVLSRTSQEQGILRVTLSPGLSAYSFTFG